VDSAAARLREDHVEAALLNMEDEAPWTNRRYRPQGNFTREEERLKGLRMGTPEHCPSKKGSGETSGFGA